jgi:hypothetical protein
MPRGLALIQGLARVISAPSLFSFPGQDCLWEAATQRRRKPRCQRLPGRNQQLTS